MVEKNQSNKKINRGIITKDELKRIFESLGICRGMVVYVEADLTGINNIIGKERLIIEVLQEIVTYDGCIVCSGKTLDNVDPTCMDIEIDPYKIEHVRESLPAFNKRQSIPENAFARQLLTCDGVHRSNHPTNSFIAWGKYAKLICDKHPLHFALSKDSPLGKVIDLKGYVLMLNTKYEDLDIFKLSRVNDNDTPIKVVNAPIEKKGQKTFISMLDYEYNSKDVLGIKKLLEERHLVREVMIGEAKCRLFNAKEAMTLASAHYCLNAYD